MTDRATLEALSSHELHDRAVHRAVHHLDVGFLWELLRAIPAGEAARLALWSAGLIIAFRVAVCAVLRTARRGGLLGESAIVVGAGTFCDRLENDRAFGAKIAAGEFVRRSDAVDFLHAGQHFDFAGVEIVGDADSAEDSLAGSGGAVDFETEVDQLIDHALDLIFTGRILHGYDHE